MLFAAGVARPAAGEEASASGDRVKVFVAEPTVTDAARERLGGLDEGHLAALVAQGFAALPDFEPLTPGDVQAVVRQRRREHVLGIGDVDALVALAERARSDFLLQAGVGLVGEELLLTGALVHLERAGRCAASPWPAVPT